MNPRDVDRLPETLISGFLNKPLTEEMIRELVHTYFHQPLPPFWIGWKKTGHLGRSHD